MRWVIVAILGYVLILLQTAVFREGPLAVRIDGYGAWPDLALVLGVFLALHFEPHEVFVAGWGLGLVADLSNLKVRFGLEPLLFAVVLGLLSYTRTSLFRTRVLTQFLLSFFAAFVIHWLMYAVTLWTSGLGPMLGRSAEAAVFDGLYTALLAPYLFWGLLQLRGPLHLPPGTTLD